MTEALKTQIGGDHYKIMPIQPWELWDAFPHLSVYEKLALKYILRVKPGVDHLEDLKKAIHGLEHHIAVEEQT